MVYRVKATPSWVLSPTNMNREESILDPTLMVPFFHTGNISEGRKLKILSAVTLSDLTPGAMPKITDPGVAVDEEETQAIFM